jgi:hypothetical protein
MRAIKDHRQPRRDLPEGCPETFDAGLLRFAWEFPAKSRPQTIGALERFGRHLNVVRLCNDRDVAEFSRVHGLI